VKFSIIVPVFNEEATVGPLLESIRTQTLPPAEVVLVDAGSTDRTSQRIAAFSDVLPIRLLSRGRLNPGQARNEGVRTASHEWLAFTDAGIRLEPGWLQALAAAAVQGDVVFGSYEPVCRTFFDQSAAIAYVPARRPDGVRGPVVCSMALRRAVFDQAGGFPPWRAAEDLAFMERVLSATPRVFFTSDAVAHWQMAAGPAATFHRFANYSRHNLKAGRGQHWHGALARQYAALLAVVGALFVLGGGAVALFPIPTMWLARACKAAWQKRKSFPFSTLQPARIVGASCVLAVVDAATWTGLVSWILERRQRQRPSPIGA
jgi:glycosyltransferase involved in cell wall biosynthesis